MIKTVASQPPAAAILTTVDNGLCAVFIVRTPIDGLRRKARAWRGQQEAPYIGDNEQS
jgi:hypothetical protein